MSKIIFENGKTVDFDGTPTPEDVDFVAKQIGIGASSSSSPVSSTKPKKSLLTKASNTLSSIFGGGTIGDAIGAQKVKNQTSQGKLPGVVEADYSKLSPEARARFKERGMPTTLEESRQKVAESVQGPTGKQIAGDVGRVALNFVPVGKVAKTISAGAKTVPVIRRAAKPISQLATGAGLGYGADVSTKLAEGKENPLSAGVGTGIGAGIAAVPYVGKGLGKLGTEVFGLTTGTGAGTIRQFKSAITKGGAEATAAREAIKGKISPEDIVDEARSAFGQLIKNRSEQYSSKLSQLKTKTNVIDHKPIIEKFNNQLNDFGVFANSDGSLNFSRAPGLGRYEKDLKGLSQTLSEWGSREGDNTISGVDKLKQVIDDFRIGSQDSKKFDSFVTTLRGEAKNLIKQNLMKSKDLKTLNTYNKMLGDFEKSTREIKEIQKALSLGDKASMDTAFRKLSTVLRTNNEVRQKAVAELNQLTGGTLIPKIAGQQLSEKLPRGLMRTLSGIGAGAGAISGVGIVPMLQMALLTSPRLVGGMLNVLGVVGNKANRVKNALIRSGIKTPGDYLFSEGSPSKIAIDKTIPAKNIQKRIPLLRKNPAKQITNTNVKSDSFHVIPPQLPQKANKSKLPKKPGKLNLKDESGFVRIGGKTIRQVDAPTKRELIAAIDYLRLKKPISQEMEDMILKLQKKYNIDVDLSSEKIANRFEDLIDKTKTRGSILKSPLFAGAAASGGVAVGAGMLNKKRKE